MNTRHYTISRKFKQDLSNGIFRILLFREFQFQVSISGLNLEHEIKDPVNEDVLTNFDNIASISKKRVTVSFFNQSITFSLTSRKNQTFKILKRRLQLNMTNKGFRC